jgi:hypothetical protein
MEIPNQHFIPMRLRDWFAPVTVIALEACISSEAADTADAGEANRRVTGCGNGARDSARLTKVSILNKTLGANI